MNLPNQNPNGIPNVQPQVPGQPIVQSQPVAQPQPQIVPGQPVAQPQAVPQAQPAAVPQAQPAPGGQVMGVPVVNPGEVMLNAGGADCFPGTAIVRIDRIHYDNARTGAVMVRVRATQVHQIARADDSALPPHLTGMPATPSGASVGWVFWCQSDYYGRDITKFLMALTGADQTALTPEHITQMIQDPTPYAGYCLMVQASHYYPKKQLDQQTGLPLPGSKGRVNIEPIRAMSAEELQTTLPPEVYASLFGQQG